MHYEVKDNDTLERIAAAHDCTVGELMKLNKMASRMVFPGQRILVPAPAADDVFVDASSTHSSSNVSTNSSHTAPTNLGIYLGDGTPPLNDSFAEGKTRGPGGAVPIQSTNNRNNSPDEKTVVIQERIEDSDCLQRFLKIKVKQMTESDGTVSGTLLVTPNCLMFDPDVQHPLVIENGSDLYGMVANMDEILSVSVYKDIDGLTGAKATKKRSVFDPDHYRSPEEATSTAPIVEVAPDADDDKPKCDSGSESFESAVEDQPFASGTSLSGSGQMLTSIVEEDQHGQSDLLRPTEKYCGKRRTVSDVTSEQSEAFKEEHLSTQPLLSAGSETDVVVRPHTDLEPSTSVDSTTSLPGNNNNNNEKGSFFNRSSRYSPNVARRSFGRLGRTLSARASSVKGTVVSGTKTVVSHTKSAAGQVQTGIQSGARVIAQAPNNMVRMGSGLLHDVQDKPGQLMEMCDSFFSLERTNSELSQTNATLKREQSLATLENLKQRTQQVRQEALKKQKQSMFHCATSSDEMPDLFKPISQMISQNSDSELATTPPELPYYMAVRLDKFKKKNHHRGGKYSVSSTSSYTSYDDDCKFGNRRKREFWYAIPRAKADAIYHFLLHWSPEKYGQDTLTNEESEAQKKSAGQKSFLVLEDDSLSSNEQPSVYSQSLLDRQWELVSVGEICRRLSLDDEILASDLPLPEGAKTSQILDEFMIRQILDILPPRAEGYPWIKIYSSEKHGFSLSTMYRKMAEWNEDMSPVLLIIRDTAGHVFGACVSTTIRPSEHYFGTGDSCLLFRFTGEYPHTRELRDYRWTGDNQFFVNAQKDSLSVGAGGGHYGLWLDADLNLGRTQRCQTFDNEPLTGGKMDFTVQFVEAFGFSM